jgi:peptidyl-tRNA hydrolase, PTH1 family
MKLIIGLGNHEAKYEKNRHNIGFLAVDNFARQHLLEFSYVDKFNANIAEFRAKSAKVLLVKPQTFMNLSGDTVMKLVHFYRIPANQIMLVYDELALPFGIIRTRVGGSSAGHNGIESVIKSIGDNFNRVRIGISNSHLQKTDAAQFVLSDFMVKESKLFPKIFNITNGIVEQFVADEEIEPKTYTIQ